VSTPGPDFARLSRVGEIICAVASQMLKDHGRHHFALLDDGSPEAELTATLLDRLDGVVVRVAADTRQLESVLHAAGKQDPDHPARREAHRLLVRLVPDSIPCSPLTKTDLLVAGLPPEPFCPLGDLYASEVMLLCGGWSGSHPVRELASSAGGIDRLDEALRAYFDDRDLRAFDRLAGGAREELKKALAAGSAARSHARVIPKLSTRTIGIDLFE
jgi:hypothetical protein